MYGRTTLTLLKGCLRRASLPVVGTVVSSLRCVLGHIGAGLGLPVIAITGAVVDLGLGVDPNLTGATAWCNCGRRSRGGAGWGRRRRRCCCRGSGKCDSREGAKPDAGEDGRKDAHRSAPVWRVRWTIRRRWLAVKSGDYLGVASPFSLTEIAEQEDPHGSCEGASRVSFGYSPDELNLAYLLPLADLSNTIPKLRLQTHRSFAQPNHLHGFSPYCGAPHVPGSHKGVDDRQNQDGLPHP